MKDDRLYLHHMVERCRRIARFISHGKEKFMATEELQDAVIRNIEVIGETAKRVSAEVRAQLAELDWKRICGMRDVLIHDYMSVDLEQVWSVRQPVFPNSWRHWKPSFRSVLKLMEFPAGKCRRTETCTHAIVQVRYRNRRLLRRRQPGFRWTVSRLCYERAHFACASRL